MFSLIKPFNTGKLNMTYSRKNSGGTKDPAKKGQIFFFKN